MAKMNNDVAKAIRIVVSARRTHERWIKYYAKYPETEATYGETVGDVKHHQKAIEGYDHVIKVLEGQVA
jgi:hypothetical protein